MNPRRAWILYDWANSAFVTTVVTAVYPIYFQEVAAAGLPRARATTIYAAATTVALVLVAVLGPILGSTADERAATGELAVATMDSPLLAPAVRFVTRLLPGPADPVGLRALVEAEDGYDVRDGLGRVSAPALVVSGGRDVFYPLDLATETARGLPDATHVVYRNRSHAGVPLHPRFGRDVGSFLLRQAQGRAA